MTLLGTPACLASTVIAPLKSLQSQASPSGQPILTLLLVSRSDCSYCAFVREEVLTPLQRSNMFSPQLRIRELKVDRHESVIDLNGIEIAHPQLAQRYQATFTPTLLLLDHQGIAVAKPIIGVANRDMYGFYVERNIRNALAAQK